MLKNYGLNFWLLCISSFLFFSSFTMIISELPGYLSRLGGEQYLGLLFGLFTLTAAISRPFSGKLTDQWGRIPVMIVGAVISALSLALYPFLATVAGLLFIRLIHGFATGFTPTGTSAYVADIVPFNKRGEALGMLSMFGTIGMAAGPALGSFIFIQYGINFLFYLGSVFAIGSIIILLGMNETLVLKQSFSPSMFRINRKDIFEPAVLTPSIIMLLTTFSFGTVVSLSPDFSEYLGIQNKGLFYTFFTGSSLLVRIIGGKLSDRFGRINILKVSTFTLFVSMVIIGFSQSPIWFFSGAFLFGLGYGLNSPTLFAWTIDLTPESSRGRGISTLFIFLEVGIGLGALLMGTFYNGMSERFPLLFAISAVFSLIAFLYLFISKK